MGSEKVHPKPPFLQKYELPQLPQPLLSRLVCQSLCSSAAFLCTCSSTCLVPVPSSCIPNLGRSGSALHKGHNSAQCTLLPLQTPTSPKGQPRIFCTSDAVVGGPRVCRKRGGSHPAAVPTFVAVMLLCFACGSPKKAEIEMKEVQAPKQRRIELRSTEHHPEYEI